MADEPNDGPHGADTERYEEFLAGAPRWLHYERARIDELDRTEVNQLARQELGRRDHGGPVEDDARKIWAWLLVEYTLYSGEYPDDEDGERND